MSLLHILRKMNVPEAIIKEAAVAANSLLPEKSLRRYEQEYANFKTWQEKNSVVGVTEDVLLTYINQVSKIFKPNSLWSKWSMLKSCLQVKENIPVDRYYKVLAFLKRKSENYVPKKAKVLTKEQIEQFLIEAPDENWLLCKVITIFGIFGTCRCDELLSLTLNDVEDAGRYIIVTLRNTKNRTSRRFTITDDDCSFQPCNLYRKYAGLRPLNAENLRLFLTYRNCKCVALNAGQHTIGDVPKKIAEYLELPKPELYTGHSFRRSGATMVVNAGGDILTLKRAGGWKSSTIAESYVEDSVNKKIEISKKMFPASESSTNSIDLSGDSAADKSTNINISGNRNCKFVFNMCSSEFSKINK